MRYNATTFHETTNYKNLKPNSLIAIAAIAILEINRYIIVISDKGQIYSLIKTEYKQCLQALNFTWAIIYKELKTFHFYLH